MKSFKKKILKFTAAFLPAAALAAAIPLSLASFNQRPLSSGAERTIASTSVSKAIASSNQQSAEAGFDAFLQASTTGLASSNTKLNAVIALYAAIGQTGITQTQAATLNANSARDLLNKLNAQDNNTALSGGWTLNLSTSNFDGLSLATLSFLQYFPNLTGISLVSQPVSFANNPASFTIPNLQSIAWIGNLRGLRTLRIVNDAVKNPTQFDSTGLSFLANLPLTSVDFSKFLSTPSNATATRPIFASLNLNQPWYLTMNYNFAIQMPAGFTMPANNALYSVKSGDGIQTTISKVIAPPVGNPTVAYRKIRLNGSTYNAVLADSTLIWPFDNEMIASIAFADVNGDYYTTAATNRWPVTKRALTAAESDLYERYRIESRRTDVFQVVRLTSDLQDPATSINRTVIVDGVTVPRVMINGSLY